MTSESGFEPWPGAAYDGETAAPIISPTTTPRALTPRPLTPRPKTPGVVVVSGVAVALVLGLGVGYFARPDLAGPDFAPKPMAPAAPGAQQGLTIQAGAPQAPPAAIPHPAGKLQVLPPDMAEAAQRAVLAAAPAAPAVRDVSDVVADPAPPPVAAADPRFASPRMAALAGPCPGAAGRAAQMVCSDPDLSAADREMTRTYRRALRSGAQPPDQIRADQRDWLAAREEAARRSPREVARLYDQRIDELNEIADDGPG